MGLGHLKIYSATDIGHREVNQDCLKFFEGSKYYFFVVADGCGAYNGSEIASKSFCQAFACHAINMEEKILENPKKALQEIILMSSRDMVEKITSLELNDACTTVAIACVSNKHSIYAHIGDSRVYKISEKGSIWHTKDHSVAEELIGQKKVTRKKSREKKMAHMLTKVIGVGSEFKAEIRHGKRLQNNEKLIICTDGFWEYMSNSWMKKILEIPPELTSEYLQNYISNVKEENANVDNLSAIIVCA